MVESADVSKECEVDGGLALVLRASRYAGVAPLRVRTARNAHTISCYVALSPPLATLQRILMTFLNIQVLAALILDFREEPNRRIRVGKSTVAVCVWIFDLVLVMTIASIAAYCGLTRMENLMRVLQQLQRINEDLNNYPSTKTKKIGVGAAAIMLIYTILVPAVEACLKIDVFMEQGFNWAIMAMYSAYYVANVPGLLAVMQWGFTAAEVHSAAAAVNRRLSRLHVKLQMEGSDRPPKILIDSFLKKLPETSNQGTDFVVDSRCGQSVVLHLALSYKQLGEVIEQMNASNGLIIITLLMSTFLRLVVVPYYIAIWLNSDEKVLGTMLTPVAFSIMHIGTLFLMIEPCHWTKAQRETTKYLLSQLMLRLEPRFALVSRELDQFIKQTMLFDAKFAPLGVYVLSRPYMAAILGAVMSYLVILLQFQKFTPSTKV